VSWPVTAHCACRAQYYDFECGGLGIRAATHDFQVFVVNSLRYCIRQWFPGDFSETVQYCR
jgi:hypothetical protein